MGRFFKASGDPGASAIAVYAGILACLSVGLICALAFTIGLFPHARSAWPLVGFGLLAIVAERQSVRLTENILLSVAFLPLLFVAVVFGPLAAAIIGAVTVLGDFGRPFTRWVIWTANRTIVGGLAGLAAWQAMQSGADTFGRILAATSVAAVVDFALDFILNALTLVLRGTGSVRELARTPALSRSLGFLSTRRSSAFWRTATSPSPLGAQLSSSSPP